MSAPPGMVEGTEFTCPGCGSHAFGTSNDVGYCHGSTTSRPVSRHRTEEVVRCSFSWRRTPEEDTKVFKGTGHFSPEVQTGVAPSRPGA